MKHIKRILFLIVGIFSIIFCNKNVFASTRLNWDKRTDIFYARTNDSTGYYHSDNVYFFEFDGRIAFCTEPGARILHFQYNSSEDINMSNMSYEQTMRAKLITYYGYDYNYDGVNHHTQNYRLATQKLIWELISGDNYEFFTEINSGGSWIDVRNEVNEINYLVNNHYTKPSFNDNTISVEIGKEKRISDTNNVLHNYEIVNSNGIDAHIDGNDLVFTVNTLSETSITLKKKQYTERNVLFYFNDDSQSLMSSGKLDDLYSTINVKSLGGDITIEKRDSITDTTVSSSAETTVAGAIYGVYDEYDNLVDTITTNSNGVAKSKTLEKLGKYYIQEITAPKGYRKDYNKYYFNITLENLHQFQIVYEDIIERKFEITKVLGTEKTSMLTPEVSPKSKVHDINDKAVYTGVTDTDGKLYFTLPYGKYKLIQITSKLGYELIEPYEFEVREDGKTVYKTFYDDKLKARLKVIKVDEFDNKIPISNIKFKIKNKQTNEYVCQTISYPENATICEFATNDKGELITPYPLEKGNYLLYEVEQAIDGYLWNSKPVEFSINDDSYFINDESLGKILEVKFTNKSVYGEVVIDKIGRKKE